FRPKAKKEDIDTAETLEGFKIFGQITLNVLSFCLHWSEALNLPEKIRAQEAFKVSNKTERIVHSHRGQGVLCEHVEPRKQIVDLTCLGLSVNDTVHRLSTAAAEQNDRDIAVFC